MRAAVIVTAIVAAAATATRGVGQYSAGGIHAAARAAAAAIRGKACRDRDDKCGRDLGGLFHKLVCNSTCAKTFSRLEVDVPSSFSVYLTPTSSRIFLKMSLTPRASL